MQVNFLFFESSVFSKRHTNGVGMDRKQILTRGKNPFFISCRSLIGPSNAHKPDDFLMLSNPEVMSAFEQLFLSEEEDQTRAHLLLSGTQRGFPSSAMHSHAI